MRTRGICSVENCDRITSDHGYCKLHAARWRRHGDPLAGKLKQGSSSEPCAAPECDRTANGARGYCGAHYQRLRKTGDPLAVRRPSVLDRLWSRVEKRSPDECWPWTGSRKDDGYGKMTIDGKANQRVHRVVYQLVHGALDDATVVRHTCDNPPCCNPAHLVAGDHSANMADMVHRGRRSRRWTDDELEAIRTDPRPTRTVAAEYGMSKAYVVTIRKHYRHGMHRSFSA